MRQLRWIAALIVLTMIAGACSSQTSVGSTTPNSSATSTSSGSATSTSTESLPDTADGEVDAGSKTNATTTTTPPIPTEVRTGAQVLVDDDFSFLDGRRVGLISHQNSVVDGVHLSDLINESSNVELVALFGPEHGARGDRDAGEYVEDELDPSTGVPVFSLFGPTRQPSPKMLEGIDVLVYDLQDVGTRYYTYISTMGLAMQAAAEAEVEFVVLDRPNPLGGQVAGGLLQRANVSFVGQYELPDLYGLTAGELATWIVASRALPGLDDLRLSVVEMDGWTHSMLWEDTDLEWIAPSPALASPDAALVYPATIYFEATSLSYGRGTDRPFQLLGAPWLDATNVSNRLTDLELPGVRFAATTITPEMLPGMTVEPAFLGETIPAIEITVTNAHDVRPVELGLHLMEVIFDDASKNGIDPIERPEWLDQLSGSNFLRRVVVERMPVSDILILHGRQHSRVLSGLEAARLYD